MQITDYLSNTFLFRGVERGDIDRITSDYPPTPISYQRTEKISYNRDTSLGVGFILSGRCEVVRFKSDGSHTVLNVLEPGDSFGILSVLLDDEYSTDIYVTKNSEILYFSKDQILQIVNSYSQIAMNLVKFLAGRVSFLNKKIETFSGTRVENRLASFLLLEQDKQGSDAFPFNLKKCSEAINAGRASVYRTIDSFCNEGLITLVDKKIYINDRNGLERIKK